MPTQVHVRHSHAGSWEIEIPGRDVHVRCESFDDARRIAYLCAAHCHPSELIVYDAYDRVMQHEHIT
jgi:hypothetical protein